MNKTTVKAVNCPTCQKRVEWREENRHRPFCSERCELIDFGAWAGEKHSIAGEPVYFDDESDPHSLQ